MSNTDDLPLIVAIYGPWGSGKSSFMNICRSILSQEEFYSVSFNPWKYDQRDDVWHALIQSILDEMISTIQNTNSQDDVGRQDRLRALLARITALSRTASWLATKKLAALATAGVVTSEDFDELAAAWPSNPPEQKYHHVNRFEQDFRDVVQEFTQGSRLFVFVDDLDRCTPDAAVTVLDAIKLFLGEASCVFVIAMDYEMIVKAVASQLGDDETNGRHYLEKLIHFPYYLPAVRFESIYSSLRSTVQALQDDDELWELIRVAFGPNPRRVRRFVNALNLTLATLHLHSDQSRERLLQAAMLLAIRFQFVEFYRRVVASPNSWDRDVRPGGCRARRISFCHKLKA